MSALTRWLAKAPPDSLDRRLLTAYLADALGTGLFLPLSVIYLTRIVGLSPTRVGLGLTIAGCLAIVAPTLSGSLLGHVDARMIVLGCFAASALGFVAYTAVDSFATFVGVAIVIQFASRMERPATAVLALGVTPRARQVDVLAWQYSLRNLGYGLGGLVAALALLAHGKAPFVALLVANAASYVGAGLLVLRLPVVRPAERAAGDATGYREVIRDRGYVGLALLNVTMALYDSLLIVAMPLWIVTRTRAPLPLTGLLFALNTAIVVILRARTTRNITAPGGIVRSYRTAAVSFMLACAGFAFAAGAPSVLAIALLVIALVALTTAELATSASEWFLSVELAPTRLRERYVGLFKTSMAVQQAVGPLLVTTMLTAWGRRGWLALALVLAAGSLASRRLGGREVARRAAAGNLPSAVPVQPRSNGGVSRHRPPNDPATQEPGEVGDKPRPVMDQESWPDAACR